MNVGKLLGLDMHYIEPSESGTFEAGSTRCGLEANRPPEGALQGYSVSSDVALTTVWRDVTCMACLTEFITGAAGAGI